MSNILEHFPNFSKILENFKKIEKILKILKFSKIFLKFFGHGFSIPESRPENPADGLNFCIDSEFQVKI